MRWGILVFGLGQLAVMACSVSNPNFDSGAEAGNSPSSDGGVTGGTASNDDGPGTTSVADGPLDTAADVDSTGPNDACVDQPDLDLRMTVYSGLSEVPADCNDPLTSLTGLTVYPPPDRIQLEQCQLPGCDVCQGTTLEVDFEGSISLPQPLPTCGDLTGWGNDETGTCEWAGVVMHGEDDILGRFPALVVSSTLEVPPLPWLDVQLHGLPDCDTVDPGQCDGRPPGGYALRVNGQVVNVKDSPMVITLDIDGSGDDVDYEINNLVSRITEDCRRQVLWTARRFQD